MTISASAPAAATGDRWRLASKANKWTAATAAVAAVAALPILAVIYLAVTPAAEIWQHLASTVLPAYSLNTALLSAGVGLGTAVIGVAAAWLVTMCRFPGVRWFEWALLLPLAMPAYVVAYVYTDLLEYAGPLQTLLRDVFGWSSARDYWFPDIRSLGGAIGVFTLVLYPYVYLLARAAFLEQCVCVLEVSRVLGRGAWGTFFAVALPLARPAIVVGIILVTMETLNDYGTVHYFAVQTFTVGIFDVWQHLGNAAGAAQLALVLLVVVMLLIFAERAARRGQRYHHATSRYSALTRLELKGRHAAAAVTVCVMPILLGFAVPVLVLLRYTLFHPHPGGFWSRFWVEAGNSMLVSGLAAVFAVLIGLFLAYGNRLHRGRALLIASRFACLGYAVPGAVLALGVIIPFAAFDNAVDAAMRDTFGISTGLLLSGTVAAIIFALTVRFLALSFGAIEAGLGRVTPVMEESARSLGHGPRSRLLRVHAPMIRGSVLTAAVLVFVDSMKELPMTLLLRPFNFETLATGVFQYASDERIEQAALPALAIVAAGVVPVILLSKMIARSRAGSGAAQPEAEATVTPDPRAAAPAA